MLITLKREIKISELNYQFKRFEKEKGNKLKEKRRKY